jgi:hypothetical protein
MSTAPLQAAACPPIWRRTLRSHGVDSPERERPLLIH